MNDREERFMLRNLKIKDAPLMLEWMHDPSVVKDLQANFAAKTIEDCEEFIEKAHNFEKDVHLAIVNNLDEYLGTISLKHINNGKAEFGITIRKSAMGKGISKKAMEEIFLLAPNKYGVKEIYWCVNQKNVRAVRFYDKNGYQRIDINNSELIKEIKLHGYYSDEQIKSYIWYLCCNPETNLSKPFGKNVNNI